MPGNRPSRRGPGQHAATGRRDGFAHVPWLAVVYACRASSGDRAAASGRWRSAVPFGGRVAPVTRPGRRSFGQPLVGAVAAGEPAGGEGRGAFRRGLGAGLDGREGNTFADDEGELGRVPGVVVRNDLLVAPGHHVVGPPVAELGGVHDEEPRLALLGLGGEQRHRVSGLRFGGVLGGGQPLEFEGVPLVVVGDDAVLGARDFGWHFAVPFFHRAGSRRLSGRWGDPATVVSLI